MGNLFLKPTQEHILATLASLLRRRLITVVKRKGSPAVKITTFGESVLNETRRKQYAAWKNTLQDTAKWRRG